MITLIHVADLELYNYINMETIYRLKNNTIILYNPDLTLNIESYDGQDHDQICYGENISRTYTNHDGKKLAIITMSMAHCYVPRDGSHPEPEVIKLPQSQSEFGKYIIRQMDKITDGVFYDLPSMVIIDKSIIKYIASKLPPDYDDDNVSSLCGGLVEMYLKMAEEYGKNIE